MFDGHWRSPVERGLAPIGESLRNAGVTADVVTIIGTQDIVFGEIDR